MLDAMRSPARSRLLANAADESGIEILASQVGVIVGGLNLKDTSLDLEHGDVAGPSNEIVDRYDIVLLLLRTVT